MNTLLIANRGEIACRIARTARAMGMRTVAVYSQPDRRARHVEEADEAVAIGGAAPGDSYLRVDRLVEAARRSGADAVHPGYGFLAEQPAFARACEKAGLVWVGPPARVISQASDKFIAKRIVKAAGVPARPVHTNAARVPYPLIVKAAAGGGGTGMRIVRDPGRLDEAVAAARREAAAAFGDHRVFFERYLEHPRHVEVQILADTAGGIVHVGERECSIQRRHQKIVEEAPSPAVDANLRAALGGAAVAVAKAVGYANAGTVEFLLDDSGAFFFLEINTRLQVEHPVTELTWRARGEALDLVRLQLLIARGQTLPFGQDDLALSGSAIEARLCAEDPQNAFLPSTGRLAVFEPASSVRVDSGVRAGDDVTVHYDSLLAKLVSWAPTRDEAAGRLARALEATRVHGVITNRDLLVRVLRSPAFLAGELSTTFLDDHDLSPRSDPDSDVLHLVAAALCSARRRVRGRGVLATIPAGWRNDPSQPQHVAYDRGEVRYRFDGGGAWTVWTGGAEHRVTVLAWPDERADGAVDIEMDGRRARVHVAEDGADVFVDSPLGALALRELPRHPPPDAAEPPGSLHAPMPGTVVAVPVEEGTAVRRGEVLVRLEAMKMEHVVAAPHDGSVVEVRVTPGAVVLAGDVLVVLEEG